MRISIVLTFTFFSSFLFSQKASVIKLGDLEKRINNDSDTTYIINFWATWCVPCVKELPDFDSITKTAGTQKVKMLLISLDFKEDVDSKVIPFIQKKNLQSEVYVMDELNGNYFIPKISDQWSGAIPATLIVNNKKKHRSFYEKKLNYAFLRNEIEAIAKKE